MLLDFILAPIYLNYIDFISIFACLCVFKHYYSLPQKDFGLQLVITLSVSDFFFHAINLGNLFFYSDDIRTTVALNFLLEVIVRFSTFWGTVMAYITYKSFEALDHNESPKLPSAPKKLTRLIILPLICSIAISLLEVTGWSQGRNFNRILIIPLIIPMLMMAYYYLRTIAILKSDPAQLTPTVKAAIRILYLYPIVQLITVVPVLIMEMLNDFLSDSKHIIWFLIPARLLLGLSGFGNAMVILYQNYKNQAKRASIDDDRTTSFFL